MEELEKLAYNLEEAAEAVGVSRPTMTEMVHREDFQALRVGRRWIIPVDGLRRWMDDQSRMREEF